MPNPKRRAPRDQPSSPPPAPAMRGGLILALVLLGSFFALWTLNQSMTQNRIRYDEFKQALRDGKIESVQIGKDDISGLYKKGAVSEKQGDKAGSQEAPRSFVTYRVSDEHLIEELESHGVKYSGEQSSDGSMAWVLYLGLGMLLLMFMTGGLARAGRGPQNVLAFGKNRGKVFQESEVDVTFKDVAGIEEAKAELQEIIDFLKSPEKYHGLGAKIPKGVLLVGPPGTGKTLLARAVAGEAGVPFISINGSEFVEMFVGVGASRVRDLFEQASNAAPCIVFIDELDAIGRTRTGVGVGGGSNEEREQTLNQLLVELDGFQPHKAVIIMSATNRPEVLDPALLRPGRFDRQVLVDRPDRGGRRAILAVHVRKVPLDDDVDLEDLAAQTPGFAGADLANLVNEAALAAARRGSEKVARVDFMKAIDRVVAGLERKSRIISADEKKRIAVHEIGHAITAVCCGAGQQIQKISIIPHGLAALGYTRKSATEERQLMTETMLAGEIVSLLGGRAAERLIFGEVSTGASNDMARATDVARAMVVEYGMSEAIGPVTLRSSTSSPFLGTVEGSLRGAHGDQVANRVDAEIRRIVEAAEDRATAVLRANRPLLEKMAERLTAAEVLEGAELHELLTEVEPATSATESDRLAAPQRMRT